MFSSKKTVIIFGNIYVILKEVSSLAILDGLWQLFTVVALGGIVFAVYKLIKLKQKSLSIQMIQLKLFK